MFQLWRHPDIYKEEADRIKELAKEKTDGARQSKRAYAALTKIEEADKSVHKSPQI